MSRKTKHVCDFCGRTEEEVLCIVAGETADICDDCVEAARDIIGAKRVEKSHEKKTCEGCDGTGGPDQSCAGCNGTGKVNE